MLIDYFLSDVSETDGFFSECTVYVFKLQAFLSRAVYFGQQGRYTKAILNCNEAVSLKPNSVRAFVYRGSLKFKINAFRLAVNDFDQAILLNSKCRLAYYNRALCHQSMNNLQQVFNIFVLMYNVCPVTALDSFNEIMKPFTC